MKALKILIFSFILSSVFVGIALGQDLQAIQEDEQAVVEELGVAEPKILPGNLLYPLKDLVRKAKLLFVFDTTKRLETKLRLANEKLLEAKKLAELKRDPKLIQKILDEFQNQISEISNENKERLKEIADKLIHQQLVHQRILQRLENQVSAEVMERIRERRNAHLEKFAQVMLKVEERARIAERLGDELEKMKGSDFKTFKTLELLDEIKEKLPEDVRQKIEQKREEIMERFRERLEGMSDEQKAKFEQYLEKISGSKLKHLEIISELEANEISDRLRQVMERVKERKIEQIEKEREVLATSAQSQITKAEDEIKKAEEKVVKVSENEYGGKAARRLLELAKKHLDEAKKALNEKKYGRAFGLATAAYYEALNAERIVEKIEAIKKSPEKIREKIEKLYPGIELPNDVAKCKIPLMRECPEEEVLRVEKDENGCPIFKCVPTLKSTIVGTIKECKWTMEGCEEAEGKCYCVEITGKGCEILCATKEQKEELEGLVGKKVILFGVNSNVVSTKMCPCYLKYERIKEIEKEEKLVCPTVWDPVCGKDGKTYSNECFARAAGTEVDYKGMCRSQPLLKFEIDRKR